MKQTKAPQATPSPRQEVTTTPGDKADKTTNPTSLFIGMALDMSWRLAIVVLVPIVGGFKLDEALDMTPLLTIVGFLLAMSGVALVCWKTLQAANQATATVPKKEKHS
jgi:F0F1-type ATP synthase assembly protein I